MTVGAVAPRTSLRAQLRRVSRTLMALVAGMLALNLGLLGYLLGVLHPRLTHDTAGTRALREVNAGMLNQETGLRGALLTRDESFLEPFRTGTAQVQANRATVLEEFGADPQLMAEAEQVLAQADGWHNDFANAIAANLSSDAARREARQAVGKRLFDAYRSSYARVIDHASARIDDALSQERLVISLTAGLQLMVGLAVLAAVRRRSRGVHTAVVLPVEELTVAITRLQAGEAADASPMDGPEELAQLGTGLNELSRRLHEERQLRTERERELEAVAARNAQLLDLARDFSAALDEAHVLEALTRNAHDLSRAGAAVAWTAGETVEPICAFGVGTTADVSKASWTVVRALRSGHIATEDHENGSADIAMPLWTAGSCFGILELRDVPASNTGAIDAVVLLVAHAATAVNVARLHAAASDASLRDALTGAANRRRLDEDLATEVNIVKRSGAPLAFIMVDVDYFKKYNDRHGHRAGDDALVDVAALLTAVCRSGDTVYRYGGEEFALVLRDSDAAAGTKLGERIREVIEKQLAGRGITVSAGVAAMPEHATSSGALIEVADTALYDAKRQGRNRVVAAPAPVGSATVVNLPTQG